MSETKARLLGVIPMTDEADPWAVIPEEAPDEIDLQMIRSAQADPDRHSFASPDEVRTLLRKGRACPALFLRKGGQLYGK